MNEPVRRIAILRALYVGDMLCAVPALRALRRRFPHAELTLIGLPWAAEFVAHCPYLDRLLLFPGYSGIAEVPYNPEMTTAFFRVARAEAYDLAIQMHGSGQVSNGFVSDLGARVSLGYASQAEDTRLTITQPYPQGIHEIRRWLQLVQTVAPDEQDEHTEWTVRDHEAAAARELLLHGRPVVGLHAGAKDEQRRWPHAAFARLGDELVRRWHAQVVLTGGPSERSLADEIAATMHHPTTNLCGATDLGTFAGVIAGLDLLVTNDTGASHLAAATRTRSVVLFGPSRPQQWAPLDSALHAVVDAVAVCSQQDGALALRQLPMEPVAAVCDQLLHGMLQEVSCVA